MPSRTMHSCLLNNLQKTHSEEQNLHYPIETILANHSAEIANLVIEFRESCVFVCLSVSIKQED